MSVSRRGFLGSAAASAAGLALGQTADAQPVITVRDRVPPAPPGGPVVVSSRNGLRGVAKAYDMMKAGSDPLDAALAGVNIQELDPTDQSVGLGGLPNEEGVVQLDASCMHGPSKRAGAVAALEGIATPSLVAKAVMDYTDHIMLVGEGAKKFALQMGFKEQNLLTEESRQDWHRWKASQNQYDNWLDLPDRPPRTGALPPIPRGRELAYDAHGVPYTYGTINMCAVDAKGDLGSVTTTSGLSWKLPGRIGDSPIVGAGQYCDNTVGAAGSTGRGESCIKVCGAFLAVELMRNGKSPHEAIHLVMERVLAMTERRLLDDRGRPYFDLQFYALHKDGRYAAATAYEGGEFAVADARGARAEPCTFLFKREERPRGRPISGMMEKR